MRKEGGQRMKGEVFLEALIIVVSVRHGVRIPRLTKLWLSVSYVKGLSFH